MGGIVILSQSSELPFLCSSIPSVLFSECSLFVCRDPGAVDGRVTLVGSPIEGITPLWAAVLNEVSDARRCELLEESDPVFRGRGTPPADVFADLFDHVDPA